MGINIDADKFADYVERVYGYKLLPYQREFVKKLSKIDGPIVTCMPRHINYDQQLSTMRLLERRSNNV